jgi:transposase
MSVRLREGHRVFVFSEYIDLRSGFDRLSMLVRERMGANLLDGDLFVFFGHHRKKCKALCYDGSGVILINKRIEHGKFMRLAELESSEITREDFEVLFRGGVVLRDQFGNSALTRAHGGLNLQSTHHARA